MTRPTLHGRRALAAACGLALALVPAHAAQARLGELDASFDGDGIATPALGAPASLRAVAIGPGGAVYAGGSIQDGADQMMVLRLTASGSPDPAFGPGGVVRPPGNIEDGAIAAVDVAASGDVLAAGGTAPGDIETNPDAKLFRITPSGVVTELTLPVVGMTQVTNSFVSDTEVLPTGHIVLGGWATVSPGGDQFMAIRLLPSGAPDLGFSGDGVAFADFGADSQARAAGVAVDGLGRVTLTGFAGVNAAAARFTGGGALDPAFNGTGTAQLTYPAQFAGDSRFLGATQRGDTVLAAGSIAGYTRGVVQALTNGAADPSFGVAGVPGAAFWPTGDASSGEAIATTSIGGAFVAGRTGNPNQAFLQTVWLGPSGAADPAGSAIPSERVQLSPSTPPIGAALTPGDGAVVAGTLPTQAPVIARFLPSAPPTAALAAAARATVGAPVTFDAAGSSDPEGEALRFAFDMDGNGSYEFDGGGNPLALRSFPSPGTYVVRVRVTDPRGRSATAGRSVAVSAAPVPPPQPVLGKQGVARPVRGIIRIRLPGTKRFVRITELTGIPNGTEIDARKGRVLITVLHDASGRLDGARFYAGRFIFRQGKGATPITRLRLSGGRFSGCRKRSAKSSRSLLAVTSRAGTGRKKRVRRLWGSGRGRFRTRGRYGAATVRGTKWKTVDRCDGTKVRVVRGKVDVKDLVRPRRKVKRLTAGDAILIRRGR